METQNLLDKLTKAVCYNYKDDATRPGITVSFLRDNSYYVSIVRHVKNATSKTVAKKVVCNATASTLDEALKATAKKFLNSKNDVPKNPIQELSELLGSK